MDESDGGQGPRRKRRRVDPAHQACAECKQRKPARDGRHVDDLEAKLKEYEQRLAINVDQQQHVPNVTSQDQATHKNARDGILYLPDMGASASASAHAGPSGSAKVINDRTKDGPAVASTSSPLVSDEEDHDLDDGAALPIIDGMVEYVSPNDSHVSNTGFEDASTFRFARNLTASEDDGRNVRAVDPSQPSPSTMSRSQQVGESGASTAAGSSNIWNMENPVHSNTDDCISALKSYMDGSSLSYLPQRYIASALLERYFSIILPTWPFLVEKRIRQQFQDTWLSDEPLNPMWLAQLNLIFAIACELYDTSDDAPLPNVYDVGQKFYLRANGFVIANSHRLCSVPMVQVLLLAAQYQQGTLRTNEHWMAIGIATRMSQGLGLDRIAEGDDRQSSSLSTLDKEICKRLWWACFSFDRLSSMVYGRPFGIAHMPRPTRNRELLSSTDDRFLKEDKAQPSDVSSVNAFFVNTVKLYRIMDEIFAVLPPRSQLAPSPLTSRVPYSQSYDAHYTITQLNAIFELDALLLEWHRNLPPHLAFSLENLDETSPSLPHILRLHKVVLKLRFLGMRILLHRQSVLFLLQDQVDASWPPNAAGRHPTTYLQASSRGLLGSDPSNNANGEPSQHEGQCSTTTASSSARATRVDIQLARVSASICVQMAQLQIETIDANRPLKMTGAWWWNLHFVFNSLCVLFGALGVPTPEDAAAVLPDHNRNKAAIRRGFDNIRGMASRGGSRVAQTERFLRGLLRTMIKRRHQQKHSYLIQSSDDNSQRPGSTIGPDAQPTQPPLASGFSAMGTANRSDNQSQHQQTQAMDQDNALPGIDQELGDLDAFDLLPGETTASSFSNLDDMNIDWGSGLPSDLLEPDLASVFLQDSFNSWANTGGPMAG
ncbi:hypothetical protein M409DRAFT_21589 [Zasmidium cellare ATCC 36951]|uniref:Xylanolytic transcriptional activator regulatory domain-containing protein n=1 Tax=Zasmidium cellare ATCC 36951 TaxID=1080233 RepID=A0A6A6CLT3_ZASCE|nr:uncharacterized protein M409DRAFT_21589 [Zasmidium cellare ATCC 36951]KAF2168144.1 hypothetical protein M409DRAFT_21589 [Zasmidium cellare ATCC 36951]